MVYLFWGGMGTGRSEKLGLDFLYFFFLCGYKHISNLDATLLFGVCCWCMVDCGSRVRFCDFCRVMGCDSACVMEPSEGV